jgi:hypothetical protein
VNPGDIESAQYSRRVSSENSAFNALANNDGDDEDVGSASEMAGEENGAIRSGRRFGVDGGSDAHGAHDDRDDCDEIVDDRNDDDDDDDDDDGDESDEESDEDMQDVAVPTAVTNTQQRASTAEPLLTHSSIARSNSSSGVAAGVGEGGRADVGKVMGAASASSSRSEQANGGRRVVQPPRERLVLCHRALANIVSAIEAVDEAVKACPPGAHAYHAIQQHNRRISISSRFLFSVPTLVKSQKLPPGANSLPSPTCISNLPPVATWFLVLAHTRCCATHFNHVIFVSVILDVKP